MGSDLDQALEAIEVPCWITDVNGVTQWQNSRAVALFGDNRGERVFRPVAAQSRPLAHVEFAKLRLGTSRRSTASLTLVTASGDRVPVNVHSVALRGGDRIVGVFGMADVDQPVPFTPAQEQLTPRQLEILELLALGFSTGQMAERLHLSTETVRNHVRGLLRRLSVHSRLEAVIEGRRRGLIPDHRPPRRPAA